MTEELTPLEAWEEANDIAYDYYGYEISGDLCYIIKNALKALEIIKEKRVDTLLLFRCFELDNLYGHSHFETYNQELYTQNITQEEYDLLKEILL